MNSRKSATSAPLLALLLALASNAAISDDSPSKTWTLKGDLGLGVYSRQAIYHGESNDTSVLPYVYAEYGPLFGRIDTFGVKTARVGYGHLEISTRLLQDSLTVDSATLAGVKDRKGSRPLGLSTFQVTPYGAISLAALHDFGDSKGNIIDASWLGMFRLAPWLTVFPQLGVEALSGNYVNYYYGVSSSETRFSPYTASSAINPYLALYTETPLPGKLALNLSVRQKWLADSITDSPLTRSQQRWNAYATVSYRFE